MLLEPPDVKLSLPLIFACYHGSHLVGRRAHDVVAELHPSRS